jgi:hypothetical protein
LCITLKLKSSRKRSLRGVAVNKTKVLQDAGGIFGLVELDARVDLFKLETKVFGAVT